mgnify:CR=1 FL=1
MKKKLYGIPAGFWLIPLGIGLIGLLLGTFFDLSISNSIAYVKDAFGGFFETVGMFFGYGMISFGGMLCFLGLFPRPKTYQKIIGIILFLAALILSTWHFGSSLVDGENSYGLTFNITFAYGLATILMIVSAFLAVVLFDHSDLDKTLKYGLLILVVTMLQVGVLSLLKKIGCRPRFRYLTDPSLNTEGDVFRAWYQFQPFKKHGDFFKSWPSGHTATATVTLLLGILSPNFRFHFRGEQYAFFSLGLLYTFVIAYSRIRCGAHYLSDVSTALFLTSGLILVTLYCFDLFENRKKENAEA